MNFKTCLPNFNLLEHSNMTLVSKERNDINSIYDKDVISNFRLTSFPYMEIVVYIKTTQSP